MDGERGSAEFSLTPKAYGAFLCRLFDLWFADWQEGRYHSIRLFEEYVNLLLGERNVTCSTCGRCGGYFVTESDGSIYPCDFFVLDAWEMGRLGGDNACADGAGRDCRALLGAERTKADRVRHMPLACIVQWRLQKGLAARRERYTKLFLRGVSNLFFACRTTVACRGARGSPRQAESGFLRR
jgi:MoaA/NifB/PqqE/SkfB family radical SAM enzyme